MHHNIVEREQAKANPERVNPEPLKVYSFARACMAADPIFYLQPLTVSLFT